MRVEQAEGLVKENRKFAIMKVQWKKSLSEDVFWRWGQDKPCVLTGIPVSLVRDEAGVLITCILTNAEELLVPSSPGRSVMGI